MTPKKNSSRVNLATNPRAIALDVLHRLDDPRHDARERLDRALRDRRVAPADARLARELTLGVLRQRRLLDCQIEPFLKAPLERLEPTLLDVLRLGFHQYFFMEKIPAHAIVDQCVELAKARTSKKGAGLVNAVLRNLLRQSPPLTEPDDWGVRFSQPDWLVNVCRTRFGAAAAERFLLWCNERPDLHLRVNLRRTSVDEFCEILERDGARILTVGRPTPECVVVEGSLGALDERAWFADGLASVQDASAQLVTHFCRPKAESHIVDWCAAPGGKAAHLAELTAGRARILALDVDFERVERIESGVARLGLESVEARMHRPELLDYLREQPADLILIDAPCTGLGTLRRNPDIRWRRRKTDPAKMRRRQLEILDAAAPCVRPGGRLVYSVCTFTPQECEGVVEDFLQRHSQFALEAPSTQPDFLQPYLDERGFLRTSPPDHHGDAFFAASLVNATRN